MDESTKDFNKELALAEIGSWIGAPLFAELASHFNASNAIISVSAVVGAIAGSSVIWLSTRFRHQSKKNDDYSIKHLARDVAYFTPVAATLGFLLYNPSVYLISHYLLNHDFRVITSVLISQTVGFILLVTGLNIYRLILHRYSEKRL